MWTEYKRKGSILARPFLDGEILHGSISISGEDRADGAPKVGGMVAKNPDNEADQWYINEDYFKKHYER